MAVNPEYLKSLEKCKFEECLQKLDAIVREMESGNVPLEDITVRQHRYHTRVL